jgi:hypothetical protein
MILILIAILLLFCLCLFRYFDHQRKMRNTAQQEEKREALADLLHRVRKQENQGTDTIKKKEE